MSRTASPSRDVSDLTVERENSANVPSFSLEEENANLRKQVTQIFEIPTYVLIMII